MDIAKLAEEYYKHDYIFVLTTMYGHYDPKLRRRLTPDKHVPHTRTVGLSHTLSELQRALEIDDFDISEGETNEWAVIEVTNLGLCVPSIMICPESLEEWYQYDHEKKSYIRIEKPEWSQSIVGWGVG